MDDRFEREEFLSETQRGRRRQTYTDEPTKYPVREPRQPLRSTRREEPVSDRGEAERKEHLGQTRQVSPRQPVYTEERHMQEEYREPFRQAGGRVPHVEQNRKKRRRRRGMNGFVKVLLVLLLAVLVGVFSFKFMSRMMNPPEEELQLSGETVSVTIPEGSGTEDIANILKENDLIGSVFGFKLTSKLDGFDGTYKHGTYDIDTGLTKRQIMELLQSGVAAQRITLTIPEGYNMRQIAEKVAETELCTAEEFINICNTEEFEYEFLKELPDREYRLEGYLFPDTYFLSEAMNGYDVADMMLSRFSLMYTEKYQQAVESSEYTLDEIVTIASMIEKEIKLTEERPRASGVIYNRLRDGIMLGIDATTLYAIGKTAGELTQEDLNIDSPYNTRNRYGLPLGPICSPGESAFEAALYPEAHDYFYYVVEAVGKDNHVYCKTYEEFLDAKEAYNASAR